MTAGHRANCLLNNYTSGFKSAIPECNRSAAYRRPTSLLGGEILEVESRVWSLSSLLFPAVIVDVAGRQRAETQ